MKHWLHSCRTKAVAAVAVALGTALALTACGGGGGGGGDGTGGTLAAPQNVALAYGIKTFKFTWDAVPDATTYRLLEDEDGAGPGAFAPAGEEVSATSASITVLLHKKVNARYAVQACNANGCGSQSAEIQPDLVKAVGYFKASNAQSGDRFGDGQGSGTAVALSADGSTLAIGAYLEDGDGSSQASDGLPDAGAVYVFSRAEGAWSQQAYLKSPEPNSHDHFGWTLALAGDGGTLVVGAPLADQNATADSGAVYIFSRSSGTWELETYGNGVNATGDQFGYSVALSSDGSVLAVGAPYDDTVAANSGSVFVYRRLEPTWDSNLEIDVLKADDPSILDLFGSSVALSGDGKTLAVGAPREDSSSIANPEDASAGEAGAVYIFYEGSGDWAEQKYLKPSAPAAAGLFGAAVSLSEDGTTLAVGAPGKASSSGAVYVFQRDGSSWNEQPTITAPNASPNSLFGGSVALSGDGATLLVGARGEASGAVGIGQAQSDSGAPASGATYIYTSSEASWLHTGYLKPTNTATDMFLGSSVALSSDAKTIAVGAPGEASLSTGVNGDQTQQASGGNAGAVYLY